MARNLWAIIGFGIVFVMLAGCLLIGASIMSGLKDSKAKVQAAVQGDQVRITGKKRDDLQQIIAILKENKLALPLQYTNFRD